MTDKLKQQLEALKKERDEKLTKFNSKIEALQQRVSSTQRKRENRLKVLIGVAVLADMEAGNTARPDVVKVLKRAITRPRELEFLKEEGWF